MTEYSFYTENYLGSVICEDDWRGLESRARAQLERYKRIYTVNAPSADAEDMAVCAMAEALQSLDLLANGEGGPVSSVSVGSVSVSYGSTAQKALDLSAKGQARELYRCACLYLDIYRGVS